MYFYDKPKKTCYQLSLLRFRVAPSFEERAEIQWTGIQLVSSYKRRLEGPQPKKNGSRMVASEFIRVFNSWATGQSWWLVDEHDHVWWVIFTLVNFPIGSMWLDFLPTFTIQQYHEMGQTIPYKQPTTGLQLFLLNLWLCCRDPAVQ